MNKTLTKIHTDGSLETMRENNTLDNFVKNGILFNEAVARYLEIPKSTSDSNCNVYCRLIDTMGHYSWGIATANPTQNGDWYFTGLCNIFVIEYGGWYLSELLSVNKRFGWNRIQIDVSYSNPLALSDYEAYVCRELASLGKTVVNGEIR